MEKIKKNCIKIKDKSLCVGCEACANVCPSKCIAMSEDAEGFSYPDVDEARCTDCGRCTGVCPVKDTMQDRPIEGCDVFACVNQDFDILKKSSSGGVFSLLAQQVILEDGVVFGAAFDSDFEVVHTFADTLEGLEQFRGSKYVQSRIGQSYLQVKSFLESGRSVLFSGAPCQIAGLACFLGKDYPNLITCDFICTGIPNPKVYRAYRNYYTAKFGEPIESVSFRDKKYGWDAFSMVIRGASHEYRKLRFFDPYIQAHYSHLFCVLHAIIANLRSSRLRLKCVQIAKNDKNLCNTLFHRVSPWWRMVDLFQIRK